MSTDIMPMMCLLHGDFHVMRAECLMTFLAWARAHPGLDDDAMRDAYQAAVEQQMLNQLLETHAP